MSLLTRALRWRPLKVDQPHRAGPPVLRRLPLPHPTLKGAARRPPAGAPIADEAHRRGET